MSEKPIVTLNDVLRTLGLPCVEPDLPVSGLAIDSRKVKGGELFFAIPGFSSDGRDYISQAFNNGACAVLAESGREHEFRHLAGKRETPLIFVDDLQDQVGVIASRYYRPDTDKVKVVGVTGTNGKTSCCWFLSRLLEGLDSPCALMGTLGKGMPGALEQTLNTTSDVISTHQFIAGLGDQNTPALAMEVSSHGLEQGRVDGVHFDVGVFTNLSRDHLDSYNSLDDYAFAKSMLFSNCRLGAAVINMDDDYSEMMLAACPDEIPVITWSQTNPAADVYGADIRLLPHGIAATVHTPWGAYPIEAPLMGRFNLENLLTVLAVLGAQGYCLDRVVPLISRLTTVPGRMQRLGGNNKPLVLVDYAHTPDALKNALEALREHGASKLTCVFGCGGDRDRGKRPLMAEAAIAGADEVIVTSDNPRTEKPEAIIADILEGIAPQDQERVSTVTDRASAIAGAIAAASVEEIVLIAGKGHESYQEVNGIRHAFDDCEQVQKALDNWSRK
ncbi:UDP-N-acetylmuramoyl-L-alanyl-D-glutamate--2,6-diaminopimelate ligase [Endozoicomonas sp. Mp262]|uniref:UDP-N-acetylmuramoyl-L-alanyl-D-glutamate--2, 6-diaminopimelate ligase n=1 Tax=Endozoicomonas sp. Mp262 TaxID=2919499 RepID=UPI0021DA9B12